MMIDDLLKRTKRHALIKVHNSKVEELTNHLIMLKSREGANAFIFDLWTRYETKQEAITHIDNKAGSLITLTGVAIGFLLGTSAIRILHLLKNPSIFFA